MLVKAKAGYWAREISEERLTLEIMLDKPTENRNDPKLIKMLLNNWRAEMEGAATYRALAEAEADTHRQAVLHRLAEAEERHAERWARRLEELGENLPATASAISPSGTILRASRSGGLEEAIGHLERDEARDIAMYSKQAKTTSDAASQEILAELVKDEEQHADELRALSNAKKVEMTSPNLATLANRARLQERTIGRATPTPAGSARNRLDRILGKERWHVRTGSWLGDAIYGINDGLGAIFGLVSGVAGATAQTGATNIVLISGLAGMVASALSMGSGAYLATKSEREVHDAEIAREREEMRNNMDEEREELELFYELKGLSRAEAQQIVNQLAQNPDEMLQELVQEELGLTSEKTANPYVSALSAGLSTAVGAFIPIIPFFFLTGVAAIIAAAIISLIAHFAVGAAKSVLTTRSWWSSGLEMTVVGAIEGIITFVLGSFFKVG